MKQLPLCGLKRSLIRKGLRPTLKELDILHYRLKRSLIRKGLRHHRFLCFITTCCLKRSLIRKGEKRIKIPLEF